MPAPYHNILSKNDRALVAYLISKNAGTAGDVFPAKTSRNKAAPCTVCYSESATETAPNSGTYTVKSQVMVKCLVIDDVGENAGAAVLAGDARTAATFDVLKTNIDSAGDKLAEDITAAARAAAVADPDKNGDLVDYTATDVIDKGPEANFDEAGIWIDALNLEIVCCPRDVS